MRKITYIIDDEKGFKKTPGYIKNNETEYFKVIYSLTKDSSGITYTLTDFNNNPININSLNGYQSMFTNECFNAFSKETSISKDYEDFIEVKEILNDLELDNIDIKNKDGLEEELEK